MKANYFKTTNVEDLLFPVEKVEFAEFAANSDYSHQIIGYPEGAKTLLNSCSDRYELVANQEIFGGITERLKGQGIAFNAEYEVFNNARFFGHFVLPGFGIKIAGTNDVIDLKFDVNHSYNGLVKFSEIFGWHRLVCTNGLTIPVKEMKEFNLSITGRHTKKIQESIRMLIDRIDFVIANKNLIVKPFQDMGDRWVEKWEDRVIEVLNATGVNLIESKNFNTVKHIKNTILSESQKIYDGKVVNDWLIYNGINQYFFKNERNNATPDVKQAIDQKVLSYIVTHPVEK